MTTRRTSINDYPEHLNPFRDDESGLRKPARKKRTSSFSSSLKGFTNTLRKSFRSKSKSKRKPEQEAKEPEVQLRRTAPTLNNRYTLPASYHPSPALPRSRFQERLAKSVTLQRESNNQYSEENNPFKDEPDVEEQHANEDRRRRRKKKAPPPPPFQSISEDGEGNRLQVPSYNSNWSLASGETDTTCSVYTQSEYSDEETKEDIPEENPEVTQTFQDFTKNMQKLTDDSNNNVIIIVEKSTEPNKEEVSISYIDDEEDEEDEKPKPETDESKSEAIKEEVDTSCVQEHKVSSSNLNKEVEEVVEELETPESSFIGNTDDEKLCTSTPKDKMEVRNGSIANGCLPVEAKCSSESVCSPVPKLRKHKLSKSELLGQEEFL